MPHTPYHSARLAIVKRAVFIAAALASVLMPAIARAQPVGLAAADAFSRRGWHLELSVHAASETWNYNISHETLIGVSAGITYGLRDGLVLTAAGPLYYVDQRGADAYLLGATFGIRQRVYRARRVSAFVEFDVGVSKADSITPPRGTQFNYLAVERPARPCGCAPDCACSPACAGSTCRTTASPALPATRTSKRLDRRWGCWSGSSFLHPWRIVNSD
jgi:hypothetical protein